MGPGALQDFQAGWVSRRDPNLRSPSPAGNGKAPLSPSLAKRLLPERARRDALAGMLPVVSPPAQHRSSSRLASVEHLGVIRFARSSSARCRSKVAAPVSLHSVFSHFAAPVRR